MPEKQVSMYPKNISPIDENAQGPHRSYKLHWKDQLRRPLTPLNYAKREVKNTLPRGSATPKASTRYDTESAPNSIKTKTYDLRRARHRELSNKSNCSSSSNSNSEASNPQSKHAAKKHKHQATMTLSARLSE